MTAVLALQGAFAEHEKKLSELGENYFEIRKQIDVLRSFDRLIIPGGESTTIRKLLHELEIFDEIKRRIECGVPVLGTCAGLITLAKRVIGDVQNAEPPLGVMNITAARNAYGRQLGSFFIEAEFAGKKIPMTFIRAPYIESTGDGAEPLSSIDGRIVAARQKNMLVTAFHPELTADMTVHEYFLAIRNNEIQ